MTGVLYWARTRTRHTAAHLVESWARRQVVTMCGNRPGPGGDVFWVADAKRLQVHVCVGCARKARAR